MVKIGCGPIDAEQGRRVVERAHFFGGIVHAGHALNLTGGLFQASATNVPDLTVNAITLHNAVTLVHRACSGAVVDDIVTTSRGPQEPPQITWVDTTTDVMTVMIGGNDAGFSPVVETCAVPRAPCAGLDPIVQERLASLAQRLPEVYRQLRRRAPLARLLVVGYPQIFPNPDQVRIEGCGMLNFQGAGITTDDVVWLKEKTLQLDATIRQAAQAAGAEYVDAETAFAGHEVCTHTPWVFGLLPFRQGASFHPAAAGQKALAARVAAVLTRQPGG